MSDEIKTLKDLEKTQKFKGVRHRGKKGTIYGIKTNYGICSEHIQDVVYSSVLRQEAIKLLQFHDKKHGDENDMRDLFMEFFNIEEDELTEGEEK